MINHTNKLSNIPATQAYVDFGLKQVRAINKRFRSWLTQQSFADSVVSSEFVRMIVSGCSDCKDIDSEESPDRIQWDLRFSDEVKINAISDALLHEHRYPDITTFNSKPQIFDTSDYIQISVRNGERGWVKTGEFEIISICISE